MPGGFDKRGIDGKIEAIRFARENGHSVLRDLPRACSVPRSSSPAMCWACRTRTRPSSTRTTPDPVVCLLDEQRKGDAGRRHDAARRVRLQARAGHARPTRPTGRRRLRTASAPLTSSTTTTAAMFEQAGHGVLRHEPGRLAGRGDRTAGSSVVRRRAVPSGVQVEADRRRIRCSATSSRPAWRTKPKKKPTPAVAGDVRWREWGSRAGSPRQ